VLAVTTFRAAQVSSPGGGFEIVERNLTEPGRGQVRVKVDACGICHSDAAIVGGAFPGTVFPVVTGHEVAGRIDAVGEDVEGWAVGERVGVGWAGGYCGRCDACRAGDFISCTYLQIPGLAYPGGFAEYVTVPVSGLARIPDGVAAEQAAPLMCAGVTTFNGLRRANAQAGSLVAVLGVGGLGHLGVQFSHKLGFETVAIARGAEKAAFARQLGADHYIDSTEQDVAKQLQALGGASVVLATAANADAMGATIDGLRPHGRLVILGATPERIPLTPLQLLLLSRSVAGHPSGTAKDSEDTLAFAKRTGIQSMIETAPLAEVGAAYKRMLDGHARFRMVLRLAT
jgi:alcohol dehydrogenase